MKYFITVEAIKANTTIQANVDASLLEPFISLAQDKHIKQVLSAELYDALVAYVNSLPLAEGQEPDPMAPKYEALLAQLANAHIYWTALEALPFMHAKITNRGLVQKDGAIDRDAYKALERSFAGSADHYTDELVKFLEKNAADYPGYKAPKADSTTRLIAGICFN